MTGRGEDPPGPIIREFQRHPIQINLGLLTLMTGAVFVMANQPGTELPQLAYTYVMMLGTGALGAVNFIASIVVSLNKREDLAASLLLSAGIVWLIGAGLCFGLAPLVQ